MSHKSHCVAFILLRYSVKCEPGQLLSYSVHEFNLEPKSTCSNQPQCIDYVEIRFRNLKAKPRFCGSGEVGEVHVDGSNEMTFEFASNRQTEKGGFLYFVTCTDPGFDQNAVDFGVVPRSKKPADININACSAPLTRFQRPTFIQVYFCSFILYLLVFFLILTPFSLLVGSLILLLADLWSECLAPFSTGKRSFGYGMDAEC